VLSLAELTHIAESIAREHTPTLQVASVASSDGDGGRVELLITVVGCHDDPCTLLLNLSRQGRPQFEADLRAQLRSTLATHQQ
jgi:hypothetical protein